MKAQHAPPADDGLLLCNLASGSRGNLTYVGDPRNGVLVDVGVSAKRAAELLRARGLAPEAVRGLLVTHEHRDHTSGIRVFSRRHGPPVYVHAAVRDQVDLAGVKDVRTFGDDEPFEVAGLTVTPFSIPHDATEPVGFVLARNGTSVGIATDMGKPTHLSTERLRSCKVVLIEFNHDIRMLMEGPYPWWLKQRVRGRHGHLSNDDALDMIEQLVDGEVRVVLGGHLSQENNRHELVHAMLRDRLAALGRDDVEVAVLRQDEPGPVVHLRDGGPVLLDDARELSKDGGDA